MCKVVRLAVVTGVCLAALFASTQLAEASTRLRVHLQGSPNINSVRITLINQFGPIFPSWFLNPGDTLPNPGVFLNDGAWVIVVFDVNTQKVVAAESFTVSATAPPTINARIWQPPSSSRLRFEWEVVSVAPSFAAAATEIKAAEATASDAEEPSTASP
jgi:hypothetical protein